MNIRVSLICLCLLSALPVSAANSADCVSEVSVEEVYPTGDRLPENLLRFYIYFSGAMAREGALDAIALLDEQGQQVEGAFLANKVDLWSPDSRRLTVLFDPGRVKTGLVAHNAMGRALRSGQRYTLLVNQSIHTVDGCTLAQSFHKAFQVADADFESPDVTQWQISSPKFGTTDWVSMTLNGAHDHVSLAYRIRVLDLDGSVVRGQIQLTGNESEWLFKPSLPWDAQRYRISIDPTLEDIVGNRLNGSFEQPIGHGDSRPQLLEFSSHR